MASVVMVVVSLALFAFASLTLWWMMHAWRTPETLQQTLFRTPDSAPQLSFSLLVPARHEEEVLDHTVRQLLETTHPDYEVILIVGHDDPGTANVAHDLAAEFPHKVSVVTDTNVPKNKPKGLNTALPYCRGEIIGVFDAEDQVHPELLTHVDHAFRESGAAVVQGGVQLINYDSNWYSLRNCLEYFFWFRSRLHLHAQRVFIPLGGNTVFVRTRILREVNGWDANCLAEDCDLGVRLSSRGEKVVVAYDPAMVTREETPPTVKSLLKQRTRWSQGFLQVWKKKEWKSLPFGQKMLARFTLTAPFLQAFSALLIPVGIAIALFADVNAGVALVTFIPVVPTTATLAFEIVGLYDFGKQYGFKIKARDYARLILGLVPYMLILSFAAVRAVWREWTGKNNWELTEHIGQHLGGGGGDRAAQPQARPEPAGV
jgi:glycosyltransferase XagB